MAYFRCGSTPGGSGGAGDATAGDILIGRTAVVQDVLITGTIPENGAVVKNLDCGEVYTVPIGYHNGNGTVTANSLSSQTFGTATAGQILSGQTAWVNGVLITGTGTVVPGTVTATKTIVNRSINSYTDFNNGTNVKLSLSIPITATLNTDGTISISASATGTISTQYWSSGWTATASRTFTIS